MATAPSSKKQRTSDRPAVAASPPAPSAASGASTGAAAAAVSGVSASSITPTPTRAQPDRTTTLDSRDASRLASSPDLSLLFNIVINLANSFAVWSTKYDRSLQLLTEHVSMTEEDRKRSNDTQERTMNALLEQIGLLREAITNVGRNEPIQEIAAIPRSFPPPAPVDEPSSGRDMYSVFARFFQWKAGHDVFSSLKLNTGKCKKRFIYSAFREEWFDVCRSTIFPDILVAEKGRGKKAGREFLIMVDNHDALVRVFGSKNIKRMFDCGSYAMVDLPVSFKYTRKPVPDTSTLIISYFYSVYSKDGHTLSSNPGNVPVDIDRDDDQPASSP